MPELWNLLHDGSIEDVVQLDEIVQLTVSIEYLCETMGLENSSLRLDLHPCRAISYEHFGGNAPGTSPSALTQLIGSGILSAERCDQRMTVWLDDGKLTVDYDRVELRTAEGAVISIEELQTAAKKYWESFGKK